jgi:hypothetical protein
MQYSAFKFIVELYDETSGGFRFTKSSRAPNLYSTAFGVFALSTLGRLDEADKARVASFLRQYQLEDGSFDDPSLHSDLTGGHSSDYVHLQSTTFGLMALAQLDPEFSVRLPMLDRYKDEFALHQWISQLDWRAPWLVSNEVMFIFSLFAFESQDNSNWENKILETLAQHQRQDTGMWAACSKVTLLDQMAGAYHFVFLFSYKNRSVAAYEKIVAMTLKTQNFDGLFSYKTGGGSCEDLDAIDLLCRAKLYSPEMLPIIIPSLRRAFAAIIANQNTDGGFCWAKRNNDIAPLLLHSIRADLWTYRDFLQNFLHKLSRCFDIAFRPESRTWKFSSLAQMETGLEDSDIFSTWFRLLALRVLCFYFPEEFHVDQINQNPSNCFEFSFLVAP